MPILDGISAAEKVAKARWVAPVLMLTAFSQRELVERARDAGAMAYLVKPFAKHDLLPAIEMAVSRYAEIVALEGEVGDLQGRLEARKLVDRAKAVLQNEYGFTEPAAFRCDPEDLDGPPADDARGGRGDPQRRRPSGHLDARQGLTRGRCVPAVRITDDFSMVNCA